MLVESTSSVYDIATSGDPAMQVLDLTVAVTLMSQVWIDDEPRRGGVQGQRPEAADPGAAAPRARRSGTSPRASTATTSCSRSTS
jgi:hypothetical protein